jgi:uncharacterized protein YjiS (DUF1127 family)
MSIVTTHPSLILTRDSLPQQWWAEAVAAWKAWRAAVREQREQRSLEKLSVQTLHDIGLAHCVDRARALSWLDYERGRW